MNPQNALSANGRRWQALGGILFVAFFVAGDVLRANLASMPLPLPNAPASDVVQYYASSSTAALAVGVVQVLSAISLFVFAECVADFVLRTQSEARQLLVLTRVAGVLSAALLLVCGLLGLTLIPVSAGGDLTLVGALRTLNFLSGGTFHVASLGLFAGAATLAARSARALPRWIIWWGIVQAMVSILSLASLFVFPAALFILLGRMMGFVWSIAVGLMLAFGRRREHAAGSGDLVRS
jgi:hypothetical protein